MHNDRPELDPDEAFEVSAAIVALAYMIAEGGVDRRLIACATASAALGLLIEAYGPADAETIFAMMAPHSHTAAAFGETAGNA